MNKEEQVILSNAKIQALIHQLPDSWETYKMRDYIKALEIPISDGSTDEVGRVYEGVDNTIKLIASLLNISAEKLNADLPYVVVQAMANRLAFTTKEPVPRKAEAWYKIEDEITYNDYTTLVMLMKDPVRNIRQCVQIFSREPLTMEAINDMSVQEVHDAFFTLKKYTLKFLRRLTRIQAKKLLKMQAKQVMTMARQRLTKKSYSKTEQK
jgi:hypothetical protein